MALTGLQIFKLLPGGKKEEQANCKKCGFPTCMAFSMMLAKGQVDMGECPYMSDELKEMLDKQNRPPQMEYIYGTPNKEVKVGGETVLFRHEKTFHNPPSIAIRLKSSDENFDSKLAKILSYSIERVGQEFHIDAVNLVNTDSTFVEKFKILADKNLPIILTSKCARRMTEALKEAGLIKPIVNLHSKSMKKIVQIQKKFDVIVVLSGDNPQELEEKSKQFRELGGQKAMLLLTTSAKNPFERIKNLTEIREKAVRDKNEKFSYPILSQVPFSFDKYYDALIGAISVCKYSNVIILPDVDEAILSALFTLSQGLYTDPQKPPQVEAKLYVVGEPDSNAPVFLTTNFALSYFSVVTEIEGLDKGAYLVVTDSGGMSVLTAWSASKLTAEIIAKAVRDSKLEDKISHKNIIIPGFISSMKTEIERELAGWDVIAGPNYAADIEKFLKKYESKFS